MVSEISYFINGIFRYYINKSFNKLGVADIAYVADRKCKKDIDFITIWLFS
ncbi:MAG: hypothetical protein ACTSO6_06475 [Promethearchaeota archaeon]